MTAAATDLGVAGLPRTTRGRALAIVLSLVLILAAAAAALFLVRGVDTQIEDVARSYEIRKHAGELVLALVDAETGQRGYLLTLDKAYLEPYEAAIATLQGTYQGLLELLPADTEQRQRIEDISALITRKQAEMASTITLASTNRLGDARAIIRSDQGRKLMEDLRTAIAVFVAEEDATLLDRNRQVREYRQWLVTAILAALAGAAMLAYTLFNRTQRQVSALSETRNALLLRKEELEAHVRARTAEVEEARAHAEHERERVEALLQDTNHRIGNSLATVSSLLGLQVSRSRSEEARTALEAARSRVHAIASGHRRLRLGDDLETTRADEFLTAVIDDLRDTQPEGSAIEIACAFEPLVIQARDATTIGILLGELVTNAIKHAFPENGRGNVWVRFGRNADGVVALAVEDDGRGLPPEAEGAEAGLGTLIIRQLARQFSGAPSFDQRQGGGASVRVTLPALEHTGAHR